MEEVIVAVGSNLGDRQENLQKAGIFLEQLSEGSIQKSSIWQSEPVGAAKFTFYNSVAAIKTSLQPGELLQELKLFEQQCGREKNPERWGPRILDLDIISYGNLVIDNESLIIPHPEYHRRLFVLYPISEIAPGWIDPKSSKTVKQMIDSAPQIEINKTKISW
jgi:2-amino-4-hydroxy-6-hydroxymethyldihydropteridine diphosphokinase